MSPQKHTPGPWYWENWGPLVGSQGHSIIDAGNVPAGAEIEQDGWAACLGATGSDAQSQANTCLIAAAPDMLAELHDILDWALASRVPLREPEIKSIQAVIAKAEGTTP